MRSAFFLVSYTVGLVLFISACGDATNGSKDSEDSAKEFGEEFVEKLYNVDDPAYYQENFEEVNDDNWVKAMQDFKEEYAPYLTDHELDNLINSGVLFMPLEAAENEENTITVEDVTFETTESDKIGEKYHFDHSFQLIFKDEEGEEVDHLEMEGQMTVKETDDGWKIERYYDKGLPVEMLTR